MLIRFTQPLFLILIPIFIAIIVLNFFYIGRRNKRNIKFVVLRCVIGTILLLILSGFQIHWTNKLTTTIFLVDVSDSMSSHKSSIEQYIIETMYSKPNHNQVGIVVFGKNTSVEQFVSEKNMFTGFSSRPIVSSTNIEAALNTGIAMLPLHSAKRIVLITDGEENAGSFQNLTTSMQGQSIDFQVMLMDENNDPEVYIQNLRVPDKIGIGESFQINVEVMSNIACDATIYLYGGRTLKGSEKIKLQKGNNNFIFTDIQNELGMKHYKVVIEADEDSILINNEYLAFTMVDTKPRLLVVEGKVGEGKEFEKILTSLGVDYTIGSPSIVPSTMAELNEYKGICLLNVYANDLNKGFMNNIESYVSEYGGGVIAIGGDNSFALGKYKNTPLEKVLPVDMELKGEKEIPKMAIALVIDHSGSMSDSIGMFNRLDIAKEAAVEVLDTLRDIDDIGVLGFDHTYTWFAKIQSASNKAEVEDAIYSIPLAGGTSIYPAVNEAADELLKNDAKIKHIILLTDGLDGHTDYDDLIEKMNEGNITLSTVSIGDDSDVDLLKSLAERGNGRNYYTDIDTNIPRIFAQEIFLSVRSYLVNKEFYPIVVNESIIFKGVTEHGLPPLLGYIASTPKANSKVLLESDEEDPILSIMQYGLGRTVAWNSDMTNEWSRYFSGKELNQNLWNNIIDWVVTNTTNQSSYVTVSSSGGIVQLEYNTDDFHIDSKVSVISTSEDGIRQEIELMAIAPGKYEGQMEFDTRGIYSLSIKESQGDNVINSISTAAAIQYSREYQFNQNRGIFEDTVKLMGGSFITMEDNVFTRLEREYGKVNPANALLVLSIILFMIDIIARRFQISSVFKKREKKNSTKPIKKKDDRPMLDTQALLKIKKR